ncbi:MAG: spermidine/putrescine ABC transporter [Acidiferrobacteraceae bacterium]|nr:spermidine/putrescine ABC transporter [Acidiferrobacteraceae bacterium]
MNIYHKTTQKLRRKLQRSESLKGYLLLSPTILVMAGIMLIPFIGMIILSLWTQIGYAKFDTTLTLNNFIVVFTNEMYRVLFSRSLVVSAMTTFLTVLLAYPMAYFVAFHVQRRKLLWIILMTLPFWTSYLLRVFAWKVILGYNGVINSGLLWLGIINEPITLLLYNPSAVIITLTHAWAAFAILPIYVSLEKIDRSLLEAATDLGDSPLARFFRITLPLSLPGVVAATVLIFIPTVGDYVTPSLVGGSDGYMIANAIQFQFGRGSNWPLGAALSLSSMAVVTVITIVYFLVSKTLTQNIR